MPDTASATAPASEEADPATDSIEGGGEQSEGEGGRRQGGGGAEDSGETDIGACGVLERLGAEVAEGLRCDDDILAAKGYQYTIKYRKVRKVQRSTNGVKKSNSK